MVQKKSSNDAEKHFQKVVLDDICHMFFPCPTGIFLRWGSCRRMPATSSRKKRASVTGTRAIALAFAAWSETIGFKNTAKNMKKRRSNIRPSQGTTHNCGCPQNQHFPMRWHGDTWGWRRCFQLPGNPIAGVGALHLGDDAGTFGSWSMRDAACCMWYPMKSFEISWREESLPQIRGWTWQELVILDSIFRQSGPTSWSFDCSTFLLHCWSKWNAQALLMVYICI